MKESEREEETASKREREGESDERNTWWSVVLTMKNVFSVD
jgi:hypothetical protein